MATPSSSPPAGLAGWLASLELLQPIPESHREESVSREQALMVLRCEEWVLNELCARGLPHCGTPPDERYDGCDLTNLALGSKSRRSIPELGASFIARLAGGTLPEWAAEHRWRLQARALAVHQGECGADPHWSFHRPVPERFGGECLEWSRGGSLSLIDHRFAVDPEHPSTLGLSGIVLTRGDMRVVQSPTLQSLYREVVETVNFAAMPITLATDVKVVANSKAADCVGISTLLEHECRRAGYRARACRGVLLGLLGAGEHSWLEVIDDDGKTKILDPMLPIVARLRAPRPTPAFTAFCQGSISNRLLPFDCSIGEHLTEHRCGGSPAQSHLIVAVESENPAV
jgi:hypothetical protein